MSDFNDFVNSVKRAALEAVDASKPVAVVFGKITSTVPLKIKVDQKLTLGEAQLVLTRNVTDYKLEMSVDHLTEYNNDGNIESHKHGYKGKKLFIIHNALAVGDEVLMIQVQGGQKYIVVDRVV